MTNDTSNGRALDAVNKVEKGISFPRIVQQAIGSVLVASIMGLYYWGNSLRDDLDSVTLALSLHRVESANVAEKVAELWEFKKRGKRCTLDMCEDLQDDFKEMGLQLAKLPQTLHFPFSQSWRDRILKNERDIAGCDCIIGPKR